MAITDQGRQLIELLELDIDRCTRTYGVSPCVAGIRHSGTAAAGGASTITLAAGASAVDDAYNAMVVRLTGGTGSSQERIISDYVGATKVATVSVAWTTAPDATSTYSIINRPGACYNTYRTCQDKANYNKGTHTYRFIGRGSPVAVGEQLRPYITGVKTPPTEIDLERGLAPRGSVTATLADETDSDIEQDPYFENRASTAGGTFWLRLLARNLAYAGRAARLKRLYIVPGVAYTLSDPGWVSELYMIDAINGPDKSGAIQVTLKDLLKLTDRVKYPTPSDGELSANITSGDTSLTLKTGDGAQYGSSGYIRIGEEVIYFGSRSTDTLNSLTRAQFGTTAAAHSANDRAQLCKVWSAATVATVVEDLLNAADIADANIDLTGVATEQSDWYGTASITFCLSEPETIKKLLEEICLTFQAYLWWSATEQKVKFKALRPLNPITTAPALLTDDSNLIEDSVQVSRADPDRLTAVAVLYGMSSATAKKDDWQSYERGYVAVDADAEGVNEYNDTRQKTIYARWLDDASDQTAAELAIRLLQWRRDAPIVVKARLDPKDEDIEIGAQPDLETFGMVDFDGNVERQRVLVTRRQDNGQDVDVTMVVTFLNRRYFWIAPDAAPDYSAATDDERKYGYLSDASGFIPDDGSQGHLII